MKTNNELQFNVELIEEIKESFASISFNPLITWAKFVLTDDKPNGNKHRIPKEEFPNIIKTGLFTPIKMGEALINPDHDNNKPIGTITHLEVDGDKVIGLAALWSKEYPEAIKHLKERHASKKSIDVSWEISYEDDVKEDGDVLAFHGVSMNAAAIVGIPAYGGRTPILAVASKTNLEDKSMEESEKLLTELNEKVATLTTEKETLVSEKQTLLTELETLREFKKGIEAETEKREKLASLKVKFTEAGLPVDEEYFTKNEEKLLNMNADTLDFFLQELVAFASAEKQSAAASVSITSTTVPNVVSKTVATPTTATELGKALRELDNPKK